MLGTRVVRGPNWIWKDQDGGEGSVGTIVQVGDASVAARESNLPDKTVLVYWDNGTQANYRAGYDGYFDLKVIDSAQAGVKFNTFTCDGCRQTPIFGLRWKCCKCHDYDLCTTCYMADIHSTDHAFQRFHISNDRQNGENVGKRQGTTRIQSRGIFPGGKVVRGRDWHYGNQDGGEGGEGKAVEFINWAIKANKTKDAVRVAWDKITKSDVYRLGYEGKVDLKCTTPALGPMYYKDHLPKVQITTGATGKNVTGSNAARNDVMKEGDKVITFLDMETLKLMADGHGGWNAAMEQIIGKVGTVVKVDEDGDIHVQYGANKWSVHPHSVSKISKLRAGDKVQLATNKEILMKLQEGHGGWNDTMAQALGKQGKVIDVDEDGDALVTVGQNVWLFNAAALTLLTPEAERAPEGQQRVGTVDFRREILAGALYEALSDMALGSGGKLLKAASEGNAELVKQILEKDLSLLNHQVGGQSALHLACLEGRPAVVQYLLEKGANKDIQDDEGRRTPLHYAAYGDKSAECVILMLTNGANANAKSTKQGASPLHLAVHRDNDKAVSALIQYCDVNCTDDSGDTALHDAILQGKDLIVSDIVKDARTLDPTVCNQRGFNPLHYACLKGNLHAVSKLIEKYPGLVNVAKEDGFTPLHLAAVNDHRDIARELLLSGHCDINSQSADGKSALSLAVHEGYTLMIEMLVEHGVNVNLEDNDGDTPLHYAVVNQVIGATGLTAILGLTGAHHDVRVQSATALYLAMHGANVDYKNHTGNSPLDLCLDENVKDVLLQYSKEPSVKQHHSSMQTCRPEGGNANMSTPPTSTPQPTPTPTSPRGPPSTMNIPLASTNVPTPSTVLPPPPTSVVPPPTSVPLPANAASPPRGGIPVLTSNVPTNLPSPPIIDTLPPSNLPPPPIIPQAVLPPPQVHMASPPWAGAPTSHASSAATCRDPASSTDAPRHVPRRAHSSPEPTRRSRPVSKVGTGNTGPLVPEEGGTKQPTPTPRTKLRPKSEVYARSTSAPTGPPTVANTPVVGSSSQLVTGMQTPSEILNKQVPQGDEKPTLPPKPRSTASPPRLPVAADSSPLGAQAQLNQPPPVPPKPANLRNRPKSAAGNGAVSGLARMFEQNLVLRTPADVNRAGPVVGTCMVCTDEQANVTFQPCNHKVTCTGCAVRVKKCLVCKKLIERKETLEGESMTGAALTSDRIYSERVRQLERENEELKLRLECQICMERNCDRAFQCGHRACEECSLKLVICHICRQQITERHPFYN